MPPRRRDPPANRAEEGVAGALSSAIGLCDQPLTAGILEVLLLDTPGQHLEQQRIP